MKASAILAAALAACALPVCAASCDSVRALNLPHGTIQMTETVAAGQFTPPGRGGFGGAVFKTLPEFCRVAAALAPTPDSEIKIEVWMPVSGWNRDLQSVGNGAWAGSIGYPALGTAVAAGYAAASTDTGHTGNTAQFAIGHPEKLTDFAYRAVHEMTVAAKLIAAAYYGQAPAHSYFNGCSTGGRQALTEAQRYPDDYDGIVAGAAAIGASHLQGQQVWITQAVHKDEARYIPPAKYKLLHQAALQACDALDGVKDGVIENPLRCHFDPATIECKGADGADCLTAPQAEAAREIYAGPKDSHEHSLFPGLEPGSEMGWATLAGPKPMALADETYADLVFHNPDWNYLTFNAEKDMARAAKAIGPVIDATNPDLDPLFRHGGKLLMYHGWADPGIAPLSSVHYYENVVKAVGARKAADSVRLFMVPGMGHCRGGDGTDTFDAMSALRDWAEQHRAPDRIEASHLTKGVVDRTRPLCPYPQTAHYTGTGSTDDAASFRCQLP